MYRKMISKVVFAAVTVLSLALLMLSSKNVVYAPTAASNDTITIFVNVSAKTMVDINPDSLSWYDVVPGEEFGGDYEANNYENIWIENIGSVNITKVWFNNTFPSSRPFATGDPKAYDPANFIVIANNSASNTPDSKFMYINRVEYEEDDPLYIKVPNTNLGAVGVIFGRVRNGTQEYFFEYVSNYVGTNCSNGNLYINVTSPKTKSQTGDVDLTNNLYATFVPVTINTGGGVLDGQQYDVGAIDFGGGEKYCVFIPVNCPATGARVYLVRWNADFLASSGLPSSCTDLAPGYINGADYIYPGGFYKAWVKIRVPYGTAQGDLSTGTVTVFVSSA